MHAKSGNSSSLDASIISDLHDASAVGVFEDLTPIVSFVRKNGLVRSFSNLLHFSAVNDLGQLTTTSQQIAIVLDIINYVLNDESKTNATTKQSLLDDQTYIDEVYTLICSNLKVVYKTYGMRKPAVTVSLTKVLKSLIESKKPNLLSSLVDNFDFNHPAVCNILVPTRDEFERKIIGDRSMRGAFNEFWMLLCSSCNPTVRKTLMTNFKIMNNFWKYISMERFESLNKIVHFIERSVCLEPTFKRATKCRILNENFLFTVRSLLSLARSDNERAADNEGEHELNVFKSNFMTLMNTLVSDTNRGLVYPENEAGSPVSVNNVTFNINNKLIYTLLTALKPWESFSQLQLVIHTLEHNNELLSPYMNWIVSSSGGYHEPNLSSYWAGHTFLYTEILKSDKIPLKAEFISLLPLSKSALSECMAFPNDMVKQLSLQIVLLQLQKLLKENHVPQSLKDYVMSNLPADTAFISLMSHKNKMIKLTATSIMAAQEELAPKSSSSAIINTINKELALLELTSDNCDSFDLVLLDKYLSIQSNNELKWWNRVSDKNSFFTSLLKFSAIPFLKSKVVRILRKLTRSTLIFNERNVIESPLLVLIDTLASIDDESSLKKIWDLLDETVFRSVQSPYKYLDKSHNSYDDMSLFLVVLFEQINFVSDIHSEKTILGWLEQLITKMSVIGEPISGLTQAAADAKFSISPQISKIKVKDTITSKLGFAETVSVIDRFIQTEKSPAKIFSLMESLGSFLLSSEHSDSSVLDFIVSSKQWKFFSRLGEDSLSKNDILAICLFNEVIEKIGIDLSDSEFSKIILEHSKRPLPRRNQALIRRLLWWLSDSQLESLTRCKFNDMVVLGATELLLQRKADFKPEVSRLLCINSAEADQILQKSRISEREVEIIAKDPRFFHLLERRSPEISNALLGLADISDQLLYQVGSFSSALAEKYRDRLVSLALSLNDWDNSLKIFAAYPSFFDVNQITELVFSKEESGTKQAMNSSFVQFVETVASQSAHLAVKSWIHKAMLYVTKKFAESKELSKSFDDFLTSIQSLTIGGKTLFRLVPTKILDTQLQVILAHKIWSCRSNVLKYVNHVTLGLRAGDVNSEKLLNVFINNEKNPLCYLPHDANSECRFQSSLVIHSLFRLNEKAASTMATLETILELYLGSQRAEDLLLKGILQAIEKHLGESWVTRITHWDYQDDISQKDLEIIGEEKLFLKDTNSFVVALKKKFVKNTTENMRDSQSIPKTKIYDDFQNFFTQCPKESHQQTSYDPEFLTLLILNNDELVSESDEKMHFNISKLLETGFLRFLVTSLASHQVRGVIQTILMGILKDLSDATVSFKEKNIIKVFLASILHTIREADHSVPVVWFMLGSLIPILGNPGHFLYERVFHYVLSTPVIKPTDIPLFNLVMTSLKTDDSLEENEYYKPVVWLVEQMTQGVKNSEDLKLLKSRDVLGSLFNIHNSRYSSVRVRSQILAFFHSIQNISAEGSDMLVTKFAGFSALEVIKRSSNAVEISRSQEQLNVDQLVLRVGALRRQKRIRDWTYNDIELAVKRVHMT